MLHLSPIGDYPLNSLNKAKKRHLSAFLTGTPQQLYAYADKATGVRTSYIMKHIVRGTTFTGIQLYLGPLRSAQTNPRIQKHADLDSFFTASQIQALHSPQP